MATSRAPAKAVPGSRPRPRPPMHPFVFVAPALIMLLLLLVLPLGQATVSSFNVNGTWGLGNYARIFTSDDLVRTAFWHTVVFSAASMLGQYLIGLGLALLLNSAIPARGLLRLAFLVPWMFPAVVPGTVWRWMLDGQFGIINELLRRLGFISSYVAWLGMTNTALGGTILANIWRGFPFTMILLLAGLQAISVELYEAADVDGAGRWQSFRYITLPLLSNISWVVLLLSWISNFMNFGIVKIMTDGGPANSSEVIATLIYKNAFSYMEMNYAAALGMLLLVFLMIPGALYIRATLFSRTS